MRAWVFASTGFVVSLGCTAISGVGDLEITDRACVKDCPDTGTVAETSDDTGSTDTGSETPVTPGTLKLDPAETVVFVDTATSPPTAGTVTFKATLTGSDGVAKDVSATATFTLDDTTLGAFSGATFTTAGAPPKPITTTVHASADGADASATLSIVAMRKGVDVFATAPKKDDTAAADKTVLGNPKITQIDLAIVMDTTGSMQPAINDIKKNLGDTLFPNIKSLVADPAIAIVDHKDYPVSPYGGTGDWPVKVRQIVTTDISAAKAAADLLTAGGGFDGPEAQIPAMQHVLTGEALSWTGGSLPAHMPAMGTTGGVDFRAGSLKILALVTDVDWHGEGHTPYTGFVTPTMASLKSAFIAAGAKFIDITGPEYMGAPPSPEDQANDLSDATGSVVSVDSFGGLCGAGQCCTGELGAARPPVGTNCRLNFLDQRGAGVSEAIVNAIRAMGKGLTFNGGIGAFAANDATNPDMVDATTLFKVRAMGEGSTECIARTATDTNMDTVNDTFTGPIRMDQKICFELAVKNTTIDAKSAPAFYIGYVDLMAQPGAVRLERRMVVIMVPHA